MKEFDLLWSLKKDIQTLTTEVRGLRKLFDDRRSRDLLANARLKKENNKLHRLIAESV